MGGDGWYAEERAEARWSHDAFLVDAEGEPLPPAVEGESWSTELWEGKAWRGCTVTVRNVPNDGV